MGLVEAGPSETQPPLLLKALAGEGHDIESCWNTLVSSWDKDNAYDDFRGAIGKCLNAVSGKAAEETDATILDQLKDILAYEPKKVRLKTKKIQLISAVVKDYDLNHRKPGKPLGVINRMKIAMMIMEAMCCHHPKIAFEPCPNGQSTEPSAYHFALAKNLKDIVEIIIEELRKYCSRRGAVSSETERQVNQAPAANSDGKTAFQLAAKKNMAEVVQLLCDTYGSLTPEMKVKASEIVKLIFDGDKSVIDDNAWKSAIKGTSLDMVRLLIGSGDPEFLTKNKAAYVVENGTVEMWNLFPETSRREFVSEPNCNFLHTAISLGNVDMVAALLELEPALVEVELEETSHKYPLQHLNKLLEKQGIRKDRDPYLGIRDLVVNAMIQSRNLDLNRIREISADSSVREMTYPFPQFKSNTKNEGPKDYIQKLITMDKRIFRHEKYLKSVTFPDLSGQAPFMSNEDLKQDHREVNDVLQWLSNQNVQGIMGLFVEDRLQCPHNDEDVTKCVNEFNVRVLNWRKLDIYLKDFDKELVEELHLYSSGNRSVHDQWLDQIPRFKRLKNLHVYVVKDVLSPHRVEEVSKQLETDLNKLHDKSGYPWTTGEEGASNYNDKKTAEIQPKIKVSRIQWLQQQETIIYRSFDNISSDIVGPHLASFVKSFRDYNERNENTRKTRVALIDSGVVAVGAASSEHDSELLQRFIDGVSYFRRDNEEYNWWQASEPHGTQMATIICSINPLCDLYVVKVAESTASGITGHNVAKAIHWARSKGVDVISLSLVTFSDPTAEMVQAIRSAREDDIVILCSTADEGSIGAHSVGENNNDVLSIAACDRWGNLLPQSQKTGFDYQFLGQNVRVGQIPYLESAEFIGGSSVSTAIAAGLASLILACARISSNFHVNDTIIENRGIRAWRCDTVTKKFKEMGEGENKKWVVLENLCGKGRLGAPFDFFTLVNDKFKS